MREELREVAEGMGLRVAHLGDVSFLEETETALLGDVVLLDCERADAAMLAALCQLDTMAARMGTELVVSTTIASLDDVFACLDGSHPQILVNPGRAERIIATGRALARAPRDRVRDLTEEDRFVLIRVMEQVSQIAERLDRLSVTDRAPISRSEPGAFRFESPEPGFRGADESERDDDGAGRLVRATRPPLPDPRLVRQIIRQRQLRARFFDAELFADPAWDMLLDLTAARVEHARVSVTSLCIASGVPPTTALRWISQLTELGLVERIDDDTDRRRAFIALTDKGADAMAQYFAELGRKANRLI